MQQNSSTPASGRHLAKPSSFAGSDVKFGEGNAKDYTKILYALANLPDDKSSIQRFRDKSLGGFALRDHAPKYPYYSNQRFLRFRDELRLLWLQTAARAGHDPEYEIPKRAIPVYKAYRRCSWQTADAIGSCLEEYVCNHWLRLEPVQLTALWRGSFGVWWDPLESEDGEDSSWGPPSVFWLRAKKASLPLILAYACVVNARNLKFCSNPECGAPFFIGTSRQKYCDNDACVRWAQRLFKRTWWAKNGKKLRAEKRATSRRGPRH